MKMREKEELFAQEPQRSAEFLIKVDCQENATWQGTVLWTQSGKEIPFRSAMELLEIIGSVFQTEKPLFKWGASEPEAQAAETK